MKCKLSDFIEINPKETLSKNALAKKVAMEKLAPYCREISGYEIETYTGGSKFRNKDTIMARITPCLENGKIAQVNILDENEVGFGSTEFIVLRAKKGIADPDYIYYLTISELVKIPAIKSMVGSSGRQRVQTDVVENLEINLPDLWTQKKIAKTLSALDDKIECNNQINKNLEEQAQLLYKSWFVDFKPFGGKIPNDWKKGRLGDFIDIKRGGSPRPIQDYLSNSGFHWLKISDATGTCSPFVNEIKEYIKEDGIKKTVFLKAGNLVLSNSATPGIPKIIDIDTCIHDGWLYFPSSIFSNEYLYLFFKYIRNQLVILGNGSVFTNLKTDILRNYQTFLPAKSVLKAFDNIVNPIFNIILYNTRETKRLKEIRDTLLPKLMLGELDVSDIDI